jgi:hypothetical protein
MSPVAGSPAVYAESGQQPFREDDDGDVDGNVADERTQEEFDYRSDDFEPVTGDVEEMDVAAEAADEAPAAIEAAPAERRRPRRRRRRSAASANGADAAHAETDAVEPMEEPLASEVETYAPPFPELEREESVPVESMERVATEAAPEERYARPAEPEPEPEKPVAAEEAARQAEDYPPARPEPEPAAITPEQQRQKRSGWWNRSW